jgi:hypothetical protein
MVVDPEAVVASLLITSVNSGLVLRMYRKPDREEGEQAVGEVPPNPVIGAIGPSDVQRA